MMLVGFDRASVTLIRKTAMTTTLAYVATVYHLI